MEIKRNVRKIAELGIAATAIAAVLVAGCGGGGALGLGSGSSIFVAAGNSPLIGVTMKVECANGSSGQGLVGVSGVDAPGEGTINVSGSCNYPIRITAITKGKMRPIGAKSDGSEDVDYDPAVNIPVTTVVVQPASAPGVRFNVDPVTTLVANIVAPPASSVAVATSAVVAAAQAKVETALGLTAGDLDSAASRKGYLNPAIAAASTRIVEIAALAANSVTTVPSGVGTTKTLGQYVAEKIAAAGNNAGAGGLATSTGLATALKGADTSLDVTAKTAVTGGAIDSDAAAVKNMVTLAGNIKTNASVADMLAEVANATSGVGVSTVQLADMKKSHINQAARDAVKNAAAKMVVDVSVAANATSGVALDVTRAAAAKMVADMDSKLNSIAAGTAAPGVTVTKVADAIKVISAGIVETIKQDLKATVRMFESPPIVGASSVAAALVGDLEDTAKTTASTAFDPLANAVTALKFASAVSGMSAPSASNQVAFDAALAAVVTRIDPLAPPPAPDKLLAVVSAVAGAFTGTMDGTQAQEAADAALAATISFAAPPAVGTITVPTAPTPPAPPSVTVSDLAALAATAAKNAAVTDAATAATQAAAAQTAATNAANAASQAAATTGTAAQTAATAAQQEAMNAHTALTAAQAAAASAAANAAKVALAGTAAEVAAAQAAAAAAAQSVVTAQAAVTAADQSAATAVASVVIAPSAPTMGTVTVGDASATVNFTASTSNGGSAITGYTVTASPGGATVTGMASPITVTGLTNGTAYTFTVVATNKAGNSAPSATSASKTPAAVPGAPTAASATAGNAQATVSFTAPANTGGSAITGYTVTSSPGNITATGTASPIVVSGLTNGTAYTFTVVATNGVGNSAASGPSTAVTPMTVPGAPTAVAATAGDTQATVSFTAPSNGGSTITGYTVTVSPGGATVTGAASPITVTGLTNGTPYTFTVTATNSVGNSAASAASGSVTPAVTPAVPGAPTAVVAVAGDTSATVSFSAPANGGSSAITGYTVTSSPGNLTGTGTASPITVTGLTNGTAYTFTVRATNSVGNSANSNASAAVTPAVLVCKVAIGNAVGYVTGAPACTTTYLNEDSLTATVTSSALPAGVTASAYASLAVCTGLGSPPGAGVTTLVPCKK